MISNSKTSKGYWMISDMNRIKYVTKHAINILSGERFFLEKGYPSFGFNKKNWKNRISDKNGIDKIECQRNRLKATKTIEYFLFSSCSILVYV